MAIPPHKLYIYTIHEPLAPSSYEHFLLMGFSSEDELEEDEKQSKVSVVDECNLLHHHHLDHGVECETMEFWPVEHPEEPSDEDRPVKCPMPGDSSSAMDNEKIHEEEPFKEQSSRMKLPEQPYSMRNNKEEKAIAVTMGETPARQMRKRHHTLIREVSTPLSPLIRIPRLPSSPTQNITIVEMLQHFDKFD